MAEEITRRFISLDWVVPLDRVRREPYDDFNYILDDEYEELKSPNLWKSINRGHVMYAYPGDNVLAMAPGRVISASNGVVGIYHEHDKQSATSYYIYVIPSVQVGDIVEQRTILGTVVDQGQLTRLYIEIYEGRINQYSPTSRWGELGAASLTNDQYLVNPGTIIGNSFSLIRFDPFVATIEPASGSIYGSFLFFDNYDLVAPQAIFNLTGDLPVTGVKFKTHVFTATAGQTTVIVPDFPIVNDAYVATNLSTDIEVVVNTEAYSPNQYSVIGATGQIIFNNAFVGGETVLVNYNDRRGILTNEPEDIIVLINGVQLDPDTDYTLDGTTGVVTLTVPAIINDFVEIFYNDSSDPIFISVVGNGFIEGMRVFIGQNYKLDEDRLNDLLEYVQGTSTILPSETIEANYTHVTSEKGFFVLPSSPINSNDPGLDPGDPGLVDIVFINPESGLFGKLVLQDAFRYEPLPEIFSISPTSGPESGGNIVRIFGANFKTNSIVEVFDAGSNSYVFTPAETIFISSSELQVIMPDRSDEGLGELLFFKISNSTIETVILLETTTTTTEVYRYLDPPTINPFATLLLTSGTNPIVPGLDFTVTATGTLLREIGTDELVVNENLSENNTFDSVNTILTVQQTPITDGSDLGIPTVLPGDIVDITVKTEAGTVIPTTVTTVNGTTGEVTLSVAPQPNWSVKITYYTNKTKGIKLFLGEYEAYITDVSPDPSGTSITFYYPSNSEGTYVMTVINPDGQTASTDVTYIRNDNPIVSLLGPQNLASTEDLDTTYPDDEAGIPLP